MTLLIHMLAALQSLKKKKMRTFLTVLGIVIGIASVMIIMQLGMTVDQIVKSEFNKLGINRVHISTDFSKDLLDQDYLTTDDVTYIRDMFSREIEAVSRLYVQSAFYTTRLYNEVYDIKLYGVNSDYNKIQYVNMKSGRFLEPNDIQGEKKVVCINELVANTYFGRSNVLGETMEIELQGQSHSYTVVGVYEKQDTILNQFTGTNTGETVYIPVTTLESVLGAGSTVYGIEISTKEKIDANEFINKVVNNLSIKHDNVGKSIYYGQSAEANMQVATNITSIMTLVIGIIAGISLVVGGIGIMNIMLVTVLERTREIGVRKSLGAQDSDILMQFMCESFLISAFGGLLGICIGLAVSLICQQILHISGFVSVGTVIFIWLFSGGLGLIFGVWPAWKASQLSPVEALRYE